MKGTAPYKRTITQGLSFSFKEKIRILFGFNITLLVDVYNTRPLNMIRIEKSVVIHRSKEYVVRERKK